MSLPLVALVTESRYAADEAPAEDWYRQNILRDDALLRAALAQLGYACRRVDWADPEVDWAGFAAAVVRTTWDYFDRFAEFRRWLAHVDTQTRLLNPLPLLRWNLDKHYLGELSARGIPVVESRYLEAGDATPLAECLRQAGWADAVIKPCVGGGARHTHRFQAQTAAAVDAALAEVRRGEAFLLQPFQPAIQTHGEDTLMLFGGEFTHAIRKRARGDDFRVQDDFGGTVHDVTPEPAQRELAEAVWRALTPAPAYGRVDMVRARGGEWAIMEVEVIEPELWLRHHPPAAERFARAIHRALGR